MFSTESRYLERIPGADSTTGLRVGNFPEIRQVSSPVSNDNWSCSASFPMDTLAYLWSGDSPPKMPKLPPFRYNLKKL